MSSGHHFPPTNPGSTIHHGHCKGDSGSIVKKVIHSQSDRYLEIQIERTSNTPQLLEWKCLQRPPAGTDAKNVYQLLPATTQVLKVSASAPARVVPASNSIAFRTAAS